jgi:hypothetical protein
LVERRSTMSALREEVREKYAAAARVVPKGMAAHDAGEVGGCCPPEGGLGVRLYDLDERTSLPNEAVLASLGCGNPRWWPIFAKARPSSTSDPVAGSTFCYLPSGLGSRARPSNVSRLGAAIAPTSEQLSPLEEIVSVSSGSSQSQ